MSIIYIYFNVFTWSIKFRIKSTTFRVIYKKKINYQLLDQNSRSLIFFDYSRNSVLPRISDLLQTKELSEINQSIRSVSSTRHPQFLSILSCGRGGTCTRSGPSIWDLRAVGCRFRVVRSSHGCYDRERHQTSADCGISRNAGTNVCIFSDCRIYRRAEIEHGIVKYLCGLDDCAHESSSSEWSILFFLFLLFLYSLTRFHYD